MQDLDLSRTKQYLVHLSKTYDDVRKKAQEKGYNNKENKNRTQQISKTEKDLDFGLHALEERLSMAMKRENNIMQNQEEEDLATANIKTKIKAVADKLDLFLSVSNTKTVQKSRMPFHQKRKVQGNKKPIRESRTPAHERIALMKEALGKMRVELSKVKKRNSDQEQVVRVSKRISALHNRLNLLEKNTKN